MKVHMRRPADRSPPFFSPPLPRRWRRCSRADDAGIAADKAFPGWPTHYEGRALTELPLTQRELAFVRDFPGRVGRFSDGRREIIIRWVGAPTRRLHPAADCFRGLGYSMTPMPVRQDATGSRDGLFPRRPRRRTADGVRSHPRPARRELAGRFGLVLGAACSAPVRRPGGRSWWPRGSDDSPRRRRGLRLGIGPPRRRRRSGRGPSRQIFGDDRRIELGDGAVGQPRPDLVLSQEDDSHIAAHG